MAALRISFAGGNVGQPFSKWLSFVSPSIRKAMANTAAWAANEIETRGRRDISAAGNFGARWAGGLHANIKTGFFGGIQINVTHDIPYFLIYQNGGIIRGAPLLWIAASWATDAKGLNSPAQYAGRLVQSKSANSGVPILLNPDTKEVKFIGVSSVQLPKKFHIVEIVKEVSNEVAVRYNQEYNAS